MQSLTTISRDVRWRWLLPGIALTLVAGLSVHVVMLQVLNVPFPTGYPSKAILEQIDQATIVLGVLLLLSWAAPRLGRAGFATRWLVLFLLITMLRETLRAALMEGIVTTEYAYPLLTLLPKLTEFLCLSLLCVLAEPWLRRLWQKVLAAGVIFAVVTYALRPLTALVFHGLLARYAYLAHDEVYGIPYGLHVLIPAYITYLEPVVACIACAALVWPSLSRRPALRYGQFALLILLLKRSLFPPFIYAAFGPRHWPIALASAGQFSLETIALALLSALTWKLSSGDNEALR